MNQFLLSLIAPALWAVTNHFNKYLVTRFTRGAGIGAIVLFAALAGVAVLPIALLFQESAFSIATSHKIVIALH
jgi:drug/metabolite transporter (DMT)-like permease